MPRRRFLLFARPALVEDVLGRCERHDTYAVIVGDDDIARPDGLSCADDRAVDVTDRLLDGPLREDPLRPDRETNFRQVTHVAHAGIDDQSDDAARDQ